MIYEIYNKQGIPMAVEYFGTLEQLVSFIGVSYFLYGKSKDGRQECAFIRCGENVVHVCESDCQEWDDYIVLPQVTP